MLAKIGTLGAIIFIVIKLIHAGINANIKGINIKETSMYVFKYDIWSS